MEHKCKLKENHTILNSLKWFQKHRLITQDNPLSLNFFRSSSTVRAEQLRQLNTNKYVVHPFSKLRAWYEIYLIYLYGSVLITKPLDAGFIKSHNCRDMSLYIFYNIFTDILCWIDVFVNFVTGHELKNVNMVELRQWHIVRHYVFGGPYFICDVLSSVSKCAMYIIFRASPLQFRFCGVVGVFGLLKVVRIVSFVRCIWRTADYFRFTSKMVIFLICTIFGSLMIVHWLACMQFTVPRLYRINFSPVLFNNSWFHSPVLYNGTLYTHQHLLTRYNHCFFKSSAYILGIYLDIYELDKPEEFLLAIATYFVGRVLIASLWIILAVAILNSRIMEVTFGEIMNQLDEYMKQKQLPLNLRNRILQLYLFKYRQKYFEEDLIISLLTERLKNDANKHICKFLIDNVSIFRHLTPVETNKVVNYLIPAIFLPNDTIIQSGTHGDAMYFISSGTVAVYTRTGKEMCHLQDGAYFGEIALVIKDQLRSSTVIALETSYVYRLDKKDMERCLLINNTVLQKVMKNAEERLKEITKMEEKYKEELFEDSLRKVANNK